MSISETLTGLQIFAILCGRYHPHRIWVRTFGLHLNQHAAYLSVAAWLFRETRWKYGSPFFSLIILFKNVEIYLRTLEEAVNSFQGSFRGSSESPCVLKFDYWQT